MKHGSLFSGIGGFDLAAEWMGWENIFHCEWMPFPRKVLNYYWSNAISYEDITKTDFNVHRGGIDILTGGFPCQPYSVAGKRLGKEDERHLWPEMLRAIREIEPTWIVGENVRGLVSWSGGLVFEEVCADLEAQGYSVQPFLLPAAGVNAPHRRDRVWFVAHSNKCTKGPSRTSRGIESKRSKNNDEQKLWGEQTELNTGSHELLRDVANSYNKRLEGGKVRGSFGESRSQSYKQPSRFIRATWQNFPTVSPICNGDDGLSDRLDSITFSKWRNESIKAGGNAIVPQVAYQIFKAIQEINSKY